SRRRRHERGRSAARTGSRNGGQVAVFRTGRGRTAAAGLYRATAPSRSARNSAGCDRSAGPADFCSAAVATLRQSPMVQTIEWTEAGVVMSDQRRLPLQEEYVTCRKYEEVADVIRTMVIHGAPAIRVAA